MTKQDIEQMNETIAAFEDRKKTHLNEAGKAKIYWSDPSGINPLYSDALYYHLSWDELMPVWIKFRELKLDNKQYSDWLSSLSWYLYCANEPGTFAERLYYAILWYNENVKKEAPND